MSKSFVLMVLKRLKRRLRRNIARFKYGIKIVLSLGAWGERKADSFLRRRGVWIQHRNWRCQIGEIDLVGIDRGVLLIVEVKSRNHEIAEFFNPLEAVDEKKERKLQALAKWYIQHHAIWLKRRRIRRIRFDTIAITAKHSFGLWRLNSLNWVKGPEESINLQRN